MKKNLLLLCGLCLLAVTVGAQSKPVIIGYVGGYRGLLDVKVSPKKLSIINYAFVDIKDSRAWLHKEATDTVNFRHLNELKKGNPYLKIMISIGGWTWSGKFSDAVLTDSTRNLFAASAVDIVRQYDLDGVDIDWEYPGMQGLEGNVYRPEDKQNYTLMFKALRHALDSIAVQTHKKYLLSTAAAGSPDFLVHTDMGDVQQYLDYINLMTYDYSNKVAGHHTNLYGSKLYKGRDDAANSVAAFIAAGVPVKKLVMGVAFYGHVYNLSPGAKHGIGDSILNRDKGRGYTFIKDSLVNRNGYISFRDHRAKAPYLYNPVIKQYVSYDDEWSVKKKCRYVLQKKMGGVMFWEYNEDPKEYLLNQIDLVLK